MNLKEVKHRILSIKNTQKITSAMKMVSSAKLRRTQSALEGLRPYSRKLGEMFDVLCTVDILAGSEYVQRRRPENVAIIAVSSDTGLCGSFNANVARLLSVAVNEYRAKGVQLKVYAIGKKIFDAAKRLGLEPDITLMQQAGAPRYNAVAKAAYQLMEMFKNGNIDKVELIYTRFNSLSRHTPARVEYLPMAATVVSNSGNLRIDDAIVEPGRKELFDALLPRTLALKLYASLLESAVSEHAARMIAMQIATDNATELIASLTLEYNKGRQQAITSEILDIVAGSANEE